MKAKNIFIGILTVFMISGCAQICPPVEKVDFPDDQIAFERAFGTFQQDFQITTLESFVASYPHSPWAQKATTVILYARELEQRKSQVKEQDESIRQLQEKNNHLVAENKRLSDTLTQLNETLDQLKGSLIELEKRPL